MMRSQVFTHLDDHGHARMVDVTHKAETERAAVAASTISFAGEFVLDRENRLTAVQAGLLGAKRTSTLIPLCHPLPIGGTDVTVEQNAESIRVVARVECNGKTGVEMEALTAASLAALSIVQSLKNAGLDSVVREIVLLRKTGGKSGEWGRDAPGNE